MIGILLGLNKEREKKETVNEILFETFGDVEYDTITERFDFVLDDYDHVGNFSQTMILEKLKRMLDPVEMWKETARRLAVDYYESHREAYERREAESAGWCVTLQ